MLTKRRILVVTSFALCLVIATLVGILASRRDGRSKNLRETSSLTIELANGLCFEVKRDKLIWDAHRALAEENGCSLASILDEDEQIQANAILATTSFESDFVWLGGRLVSNPGPENWVWDDGEVWLYENFAPGEPDNLHLGGGNETRLAMVDGLWHDTEPLVDFPALYKCPCSPSQSLDKPTASSAPASSVKPNITVPIASDECRIEVATGILSWEEHQASAGSQGCALASVTSNEEHDEISSVIEDAGMSTRLVWLGGRNFGTPGQPGPSNWEWTDGSSWEFERWMTDQPNGQNPTSGASLAVATGNGVWYDVVDLASMPAVYKCGCSGNSPLLPRNASAAPTGAPAPDTCVAETDSLVECLSERSVDFIDACQDCLVDLTNSTTLPATIDCAILANNLCPVLDTCADECGACFDEANAVFVCGFNEGLAEEGVACQVFCSGTRDSPPSAPTVGLAPTNSPPGAERPTSPPFSLPFPSNPPPPPTFPAPTLPPPTNPPPTLSPPTNPPPTFPTPTNLPPTFPPPTNPPPTFPPPTNPPPTFPPPTNPPPTFPPPTNPPPTFSPPPPTNPPPTFPPPTDPLPTNPPPTTATTQAADVEVQWTIRQYDDMTAAVGQRIVFTWGGFHNVYIHPTGDCSPDGQIEVGLESPTIYEVKPEDSGTTITFACNVSGHCDAGQIVNFVIA